MMEATWTAERLAEALVDAVERGVPVSVTIGSSTTRLNQSGPEAE